MTRCTACLGIDAGARPEDYQCDLALGHQGMHLTTVDVVVYDDPVYLSGSKVGRASIRFEAHESSDT